MKFFAFVTTLLLFVSCQENDDLVYEIHGVGFSATKLQSNDVLPFTIEDSINGSHFGFRIHWDAESNNAPYDPVETSIRQLNGVKEFSITSNQTFAGRSPGNPLNSIFYIYFAENLDEIVLENGLPYYTDSFDHFYQEKSSLLKAKSEIDPGNYTFYFRTKFYDETVILDTLTNIKIK